MKRLLLFISIAVFVASGLKAQSNIKIALNSMQQKEKVSNTKQGVSATYYAKNKQQVDAIQQAFKKECFKASMILEGKNKQKNNFETLIFKSKNTQDIYTLEVIGKANAKITYLLSNIKDADHQINELTKDKNNNIRYCIPKNGYININGKHMTMKQARKRAIMSKRFPIKALVAF